MVRVILKVISISNYNSPSHAILSVLSLYIDSCRTKNFESGKAYKATWGDGGDSSSNNVVSKQPGRVTNGQPQQATPGAASGGYIKRYSSSFWYFYPFPN